MSNLRIIIKMTETLIRGEGTNGHLKATIEGAEAEVAIATIQEEIIECHTSNKITT